MMDVELNDDELMLLQAFLSEHFETSGSMPLDMVHGFLTTALSGPAPIATDVWLPQVLGEVDSASQQAAQINGLLQRFCSSIRDELDREDYAPLLSYHTEGVDPPLPLPYAWCEGYLRGWSLHGDSTLDEMLQQQEVEFMLAPIMVFMMYEEAQLLDPPDEQVHREAVYDIAGSVQNIYNWWQARRGNGGQELK